jgi:hypothetical protein
VGGQYESDFREIGWDIKDWFDVAQDTDECRMALVSTVMNFPLP